MTSLTDLEQAIDDMMAELTANSAELNKELGRQAALWNILRCIREDLNGQHIGPPGQVSLVLDASSARQGLNGMVEAGTLDDWVSEFLQSAGIKVGKVTHEVLHARQLLDLRGALRIVVSYHPS